MLCTKSTNPEKKKDEIFWLPSGVVGITQLNCEWGKKRKENPKEEKRGKQKSGKDIVLVEEEESCVGVGMTTLCFGGINSP